MTRTQRATRLSTRTSLTLAAQGLRGWGARQIGVAILAAVVVAVVVGVATVLIPNPVFARDIPPEWWNYPVWLVTSALSGLLVATYVRSASTPVRPADQGEQETQVEGPDAERRTSRLGVAGGVLAWFAVGCPVCNKLALVALGYSGAITWFAPVQPFLAAGALLMTALALVWRLRGQVACPTPVRAGAFAR